MKKIKSSPKTIQELKKEKSKTNWGKVLADKENSSAVMARCKKSHDSFQ